MKTIIDKMVSDYMDRKNQILEDFFKAYLCNMDKEYFLKLAKDDFRRVQLVETKNEDGGSTFQFKLKKGRLPKIVKLK